MNPRAVKRGRQTPSIDIESLKKVVSGAISSALSVDRRESSNTSTFDDEVDEDDMNDFVHPLPKKKAKKTLR